MRVKVKDEIYNGKEEMIMVILSEDDKKHIRNMGSDLTKYANGPSGTSVEEMKEFMCWTEGQGYREKTTRAEVMCDSECGEMDYIGIAVVAVEWDKPEIQIEIWKCPFCGAFRGYEKNMIDEHIGNS